MKVNYSKKISYFEIDTGFKMPPSRVFQLFQEAAVTHSEIVGYGMNPLIRNGWGWVLNKIDMEIFRYPEYKEDIEVATWSRGIRGVTGLREFEIFSGQNKLVSASSVWVFVDIRSGKIKRVSGDMNDIYTVTKDIALNPDLGRWKANTDFQPDHNVLFTTRYSDYDPLGHVNNCMYVHYLETLVSRLFDNEKQILKLKIQFHKEIGQHIEMVKGGLKQSGEEGVFKIYDAQTLYAGGEVSLTKQT